MSKTQIKHILVIRLSAIGDVAISANVILKFASLFPDIKVTVLTREMLKPIFSDIPNVAVFCPDLEGEHKGVKGLWRLSRQLIGLEIDAVADLHGVIRSHILDFFFSVKGLRVSKIDKGRTDKKALTRSQNKKFIQLKSSAQRYADVFSDLGFDLGQLTFFPKKSIPSKLVLGKGFKKIGMAPFASFPGKTYSLEKTQRIIAELSQKDTCQILLFGGGKSQIKALDELQGKYRNTISLASCCSFEEQLAVISNLDVMVSMDSGNSHLSAMYGVPVVVIWGVTHPYAGFEPLSEHINLCPDLEKYPAIPTSIYGNKAPDDYLDAINSIKELQIIEAVSQLLAEMAS